MARWERALVALRAALPPGGAGPVLDLGCAFGYGTAKLANEYRVIGLDLSFDYVQRAKRAHPGIPFLVASAQALPFAEGTFAGLVCLDVIEHVPDDAAALDEMTRVAAPGAPVIVSTPHQGWLAGLDSLNLYQRVRRSPWGRLHLLPPPPEIGEGLHRHYTADALLAPVRERLVPEREWVTGLGLAELIHLPLLVLVRGRLGWQRAFSALEYLYFGAYLAEDHIPLPRRGYHLMIQARRAG